MGLLTDTHCHLNLTIFQEDMKETLERAWENGIGRILVPGIDIETSQAAVALADQYSNLYAAVGVHPGSAKTWNDDCMSILRDLAQHPKSVAIGEIGLDYFRDRSPRALQREVFRAQLELAGELGLPVIIHNRDSFEDVWKGLCTWQDELSSVGSAIAQHPGVLHSFDGTTAAGQQAASKGFYLGISGPVTFKNAPERQITTESLPLDNLLIETDAPYLTPHPYRGRRNEPAYVALVAQKVSELHEISLEAAAKATWRNADQLFNWGANP
ncbi:MAG: TatD family hydrolase [Anaerolineaceae bacterium]|nr:TatD family hydrolase [Anaerolineaceae bacterium]